MPRNRDMRRGKAARPTRDHETTTASAMSEQPHSEIESRRSEISSIISVSGTLSGLCITIVAFMHTYNQTKTSLTIADDMLAVCSAVFLLCIYASFGALKTKGTRLAAILVRATDALFLMALTTMVFAAFVLVYAII